MNLKAILVLDICSSSNILEKMKSQDLTEDLMKFYLDIFQFIINYPDYKFQVYKYIGDGFILISDIDINKILEFVECLALYVNNILINDMLEKMESPNLPRLGITFGLDIGELYQFDLQNEKEYISRAINVASRLQSQLKESWEVNRCNISATAFSKITNPYLKRSLAKRKAVLHNISHEDEIVYYQYFTSYSKPDIKRGQKINITYINNDDISLFKYLLHDNSGNIIYISSNKSRLSELHPDDVINTLLIEEKLTTSST